MRFAILTIRRSRSGRGMRRLDVSARNGARAAGREIAARMKVLTRPGRLTRAYRGRGAKTVVSVESLPGAIIVLFVPELPRRIGTRCHRRCLAQPQQRCYPASPPDGLVAPQKHVYAVTFWHRQNT